MENSTMKKQGIGMIIVLTVQYLLGMGANLFIQFPSSKNQGILWEFAWKQFSIALHIIIGILLLIGSIVLLVRSIQHKNKLWIVVSSVGVVTILLAGLSGARFIPTQQPMYSFSMAVAFIITCLSYFWGVYKTTE